MGIVELYYRMLGLEIGISLKKVNQAYWGFISIWYPERLLKANKRL